MSIQKATNELYRCFQLLNDHLFWGELPLPTITIQTKGRRNTFGWCSNVEIWQDKAEVDKRYEINIAAEHLDRDPVEIIETLLHEMVHLYCATNGIKDCSRGSNYHNAKFRDAAEEHGMVCDASQFTPKHGWAFAKLKKSTTDLIKSWDVDEKAFQLARRPPPTPHKKSNSYKLACPLCGTKLRATRPGVAVICKDCCTEFIEC